MKPTNQDVAEAKAENVVNALRAALYFLYIIVIINFNPLFFIFFI